MFEFNDLNDYYLVKIVGDFDMINSGEIKKMILEKVANIFSKDLIIDLTNVSYIDSSGLGVLIGLHKQCKLNGKKLKLFGLNKQLKELFALTSLNKILNIYDTLEESIKED